MRIKIELTSETEARFKVQALRNSVKTEDYVNKLIEEEVERRERIEKASEKTFDEILALIHKEFEESGMTEEELDELIERERQAVWEEKHGKN